MRIAELIEALRASRATNFIWGSGCSALYRSSITMPADPAIREAARKYDSDPLLSEIKRRFFERTAGIEDAHSCLLALNDYERKQVLSSRTSWSNICMAELLRTGRAARVLTTNFDGSLVRATAAFRMMLPLYRRNYPELREASTPCIYLLGDAPVETIARLIRQGASAGPWIVIGSSGRHFGLAQTLLSVARYELGLYWVGHFHEEPPPELRDGLFTEERNAHWITGFDADSFMAYLLRGLGEFPPPGLRTEETRKAPDRCLAVFETPRPESPNLRSILQEVDRFKRAARPDVKAFLEKLAYDDELAARAGHPSFAFGHAAHTLSEHRSPREMKSFLIRAAELMEPDAPGNSDNFPQVCCKLARYNYGARADAWYARADAVFAQMDFGPGCGAIMPYGHLPKWASLLAEWACFERRDESEALFARARAKFLEGIGRCAEAAASPRSAAAAGRMRKSLIVDFIPVFHQRARMVSAESAVQLLAEARTWVEELRPEEGLFTEFMARHLFREAEAAPQRQQELLNQAEAQFQKLLRMAPNQVAIILCNRASGFSELAMARSGDDATRLYREAELKFQEVEKIQPGLGMLQKNWSSMLIREARERGGAADLLERARGHAERAGAIEIGAGAYNLSCIAAETGDRDGVMRWLEHAAEFGRIPRLSHVLADESFERFRREVWFLSALDGIFDAGLVAAGR